MFFILTHSFCLLFELQKLAGSLDCLIDFTNLSITTYLRSRTRASAIVRKIMSSGPFQEWSPQFFFGLQLPPKDIFTLWSSSQDVRDGTSSAGESKHHKERVHNSSMCSSFLGYFVAHPAWFPICESPSCKRQSISDCILQVQGA